MKTVEEAIWEIGGHPGRECYQLLRMAVTGAMKQHPRIPQMKELWMVVKKEAHKETTTSVSKALERAVADLCENGDKEILSTYQRSWQYEAPYPREFIRVMAQRLWIEWKREIERSHQILAADSGEDKFGVNHLLVHLSAKDQGVSHEVVDDPGVALGVAVDSGKGGGVDDGVGAAGAGDLVTDVVGHLGIGEASKIVVYGDALAEGLMDRLSQGAVQIGLTTEDEGKAVDRIIAVVHEHLDIVENSGGEVLGLIHSQEKGLAFILVKMEDLGLDGVKHPRLAAFRLQAQDST